jgi:cytoskeletal protein RodZ
MAESSNAPVAGVQSRISSLQARLDQLHRDIAKERSKASRTAVFTLIAGLVILGLLGVYFYFGYTMFEEVKDPDKIVDFASQQVNEKIPDARHQAETQIKDSAPRLAEQLSAEAQRQTPVATQKITENVLDQMENLVNNAMGSAEEHFRSYLRANKEMLNRKFEEIRKNPTLAQKSLEELEVPLETEFGGDMKLNARDVAWVFASIDAKLKSLKANKDLTTQQKLERRWWMLVRAMYVEHAAGALEQSPLIQDK